VSVAAYLDVPLPVLDAIRGQAAGAKIEPSDLLKVADRTADEVGAYHVGDVEWLEFWINSIGHLEDCPEHANHSSIA